MSSNSLKYLLKSKSFKFMRDRKDVSHKLQTYSYAGKDIYYRTSTSDMTLVYEILLKSECKSEYYIPRQINPEVIFDIGGNIGITAIYLANRFPQAKIYSFEPLPDNYKILEKNIQSYENIKAFNFGLGSKDGNFDVYLSKDPENFGGVSFYPDASGVGNSTPFKCKIKSMDNTLKSLDISLIDLIKIDTEGAEFDILTNLDKEILRNVSWITGELHGNQDFELLDYLTKLGFSIGMKKEINNRLFMFHAGKSEIIAMMNKAELRAL